MPFSMFPFLFRKRKKPLPPAPQSRPMRTRPNIPNTEDLVRRYFFNERGFQTYGSFFAYWGGFITAGHVVRECKEKIPPFAKGPMNTWPGGLDAALIGCRVPDDCPPEPVAGQDIRCIGFPAGSSHPAMRTAKVYIQRPGAAETWIAHILSPDEPVVSGMSGGAVLDAKSGEPIGILITRNSPADLNNDRDPDESFDFISLSGVWQAMQQGENFV